MAVKRHPKSRVDAIPQFALVTTDDRLSAEFHTVVSQFAVIIVAMAAMISIALAVGYSVGRNRPWASNSAVSHA
jgi:hypothetical protein